MSLVVVLLLSVPVLIINSLTSWKIYLPAAGLGQPPQAGAGAAAPEGGARSKPCRLLHAPTALGGCCSLITVKAKGVAPFLFFVKFGESCGKS